MNFKEKSRWKYCFIIVFPNANKTILKETKIYLLIKGHFQMKFCSLSFIKSNKLVVEILLIKWYTKCYVEWNLIWLMKSEKLFGKGNESEFFYNIYWKNHVKLCFEEMQRKITYKRFIWNTTAQTWIHITVLSCSFFSKCVEDTFVIWQISNH